VNGPRPPLSEVERLLGDADCVPIVLELLGDSLSDQLSLRLGILHLKDVELHLLARKLFQLAPDPISLRTAATDHDARAGGVDVHPHPVAGALDLDLRNARPLHALGQQSTDRDVLFDVLGVLLIRVPAGLPVGRDTEPKAVRVDLLTH